MEQPVCFVLLPSPEMLDISFCSPRFDATGTLEDFNLVVDWLLRTLKESTFAELHRLLYVRQWGYRQRIEARDFDSVAFTRLVTLIFTVPFFSFGNEPDERRREKGMFLWYYTGHGLLRDTANRLGYSSTPDFGVRIWEEANNFVKENRPVKGGELCLHDFGFCDLYGLLKPWIAFVKPPIREEEKTNKHLVILLDSCHSGMLAEELKDFEDNMRKKGDSLLNDNSVTIQAACGPNESTFGGYFTPCFVYLNDPENEEVLNELKDKWERMTDEEKNEYRSIELPSPMVVTTRASPQSTTMETQPEGVTMELNVTGFKLTLFPDAGFFKFCSIKVFQHQQDKALGSAKERALTPSTADTFIKSGTFTVLDYKLKSYKGSGPTDPNAGSPMGLFLLDDPHNPGFAVCAHVHFKPGSSDVDDVQRINLVHHKTPPLSSTLYVQDGGKVMVQMTTAAEITDAIKLVEACRHFVESNEPGRWYDLSRWNMAGNQIGVNKLIRLKERSAWEESYLKYIEQFNLPKASG